MGDPALPGHTAPASSSAGSSDGFEAEVLGRDGPDGGLFHLRFPSDAFELLERCGHVPLPPYITHEDTAEDERRYQTVFAREVGAVAAPTAGLHFDEPLLAALFGEAGLAEPQARQAAADDGVGAAAVIVVADAGQRGRAEEQA